ncbi:MAG TPA: response regulator [Ktedonobacteraceae bacterium]|nr:response regulator [Ktedonobacteraceae bacterium]
MLLEGNEHPSSTEDKVVLIVDDDRDIGEILQKIILEQTNYRVVWIAESELTLDVAPYLKPSVMLLDYMLPDMLGLELYDRLQERENMRGIPTVLISARASLPLDQLRERGIYLLRKPFEMDTLLDILAELIV